MDKSTNSKTTGIRKKNKIISSGLSKTPNLKKIKKLLRK